MTQEAMQCSIVKMYGSFAMNLGKKERSNILQDDAEKQYL